MINIKQKRDNMESTEVIVNGKRTVVPVPPWGTCFLTCLRYNEKGYMHREMEWFYTGGEHPAIRMEIFHKAILYLESVIAKQKKSIEEEGSDLGTDVELYFYMTDKSPYSRSHFIWWHEKKLNEIRQK